MNPRNGNYGRGFGDYFGYRELLEGWLDGGDFEGLELDTRPCAAVERGPMTEPAGRRRHRGRRRASAPRSPRSWAGRAGSSSRVDPLVSLDGSEQLPATEETTAGRIVAAGGAARGLGVSR